MKSNLPKKKSNQFKLLYLPIIISIISFFIIAIIAHTLTFQLMKKQLIDNNTQLVELLSRKIESELTNTERYLSKIHESLLSEGNKVLDNKSEISNEYLNQIATTLKIDTIYYYNSNGKIINSSDGLYLGWTPKEGDPIDGFMKSGQKSYVEDIRKFTETEDYYQFVYVKSDEGDFIQLGYHFETIKHLTKPYISQSIIEKLIQEDNYIVYALVTDENLISIADTDFDDLGSDYGNAPTYNKVLQGETASIEWYYPRLDEKVIEIITPLKMNDSIFGIVSIGVSKKPLEYNSIILAGIVFFTTFLISLIYLWLQNKNLVRPIKTLIETIDSINIDYPEKKFNADEDSVFYDLYESVENLLGRLHNANQKNKTLNDKVIELAYRDYLTKLPNRFSFKQDFERLISSNYKVALILLDLNNFKDINDTRGHTFGDELLVLLGQRLNDISDENLVVSRYGGDEFMFGVGFNHRESLTIYIDKIKSVFYNPFIIRDEFISVDGSIGISIFPDDSEDIEELTSFSDMAMYEVKSTKKPEAFFYERRIKDEKIRNSEIKKCLKEGIENDGFKLLYQPILDATTFDIHSYEALIRFKNNPIYPDEFIPVAETTGLIIPIGRYVIESAIKQIAFWKSESHASKRVSINFSTKQFYDDTLFEFIDEKLNTYNVSGNCLSIEITETLMLEKSIEEVNKFLGNFKQRGIKVELDDFGTGFASIIYLNQFSLDTIKLDKSFVEWNLKDSNKGVFIEWIKLFKAYNLNIVAEGVETKDQYEKIKASGADYVQGYYFSKPVLPEELIDFNFDGENS